MNAEPTREPQKSPLWANIKSKINYWIERTRALNGEPRYVAMGMAVGIFVAATPTIPFQTFIAVTLAFMVRGSKSAAAIGVWLSNPITLPVFYLASYKTGVFLFGTSNGAAMASYTTSDLLKLGLDISLAAIAGGAVIGVFLAIGAYFITREIVSKIRSREKRSQKALGRKQTADRSRQATGKRRPKTEDREQIVPVLVSTHANPAVECSTSGVHKPVRGDHSPRT